MSRVAALPPAPLKAQRAMVNQLRHRWGPMSTSRNSRRHGQGSSTAVIAPSMGRELTLLPFFSRNHLTPGTGAGAPAVGMLSLLGHFRELETKTTTARQRCSDAEI